MDGIVRARRFAMNVGIFWQVITYAVVIVATAAAFVQHPSLLGEPKGWLILLLTLAYVSWYSFGSSWMTQGNPGRYWARRTRGEGHKLNPRGIVVWAGILLIGISLTLLDSNYVLLLWIAYGTSVTMLPMPQGLLLVVPTSLTLLFFYGWLPKDTSPGQLVEFAGNLLVLAIYTGIVYFPFVLLRERFQREHVLAELEHSHQKLAEAHQQLEESATRDRELAVLRERERLARELHDTLGHSLALMTVKLEAAQRLRTKDPARADHEVAATQGVARGALAELREALANLRAPSLAREPLGEVLSRRARELSSYAGWTVEYDIAEDLCALNERTYETLLRVGLEALTNVEHHARAHAVRLELRREWDDIVLRIIDDGQGVLVTNPPSVPAVAAPLARARSELTDASEQSSEAEVPLITSAPGHYGITGMRERVTALGGRFHIGPAAGKGLGTLVEARVPAPTPD
ncbi:MAG TPA: sensor histidine kinase [Ktedonobacterales bacterium]|nr:sensor histidine kinase [Ktedonobacterales bacterium]